MSEKEKAASGRSGCRHIRMTGSREEEENRSLELKIAMMLRLHNSPAMPILQCRVAVLWQLSP